MSQVLVNGTSDDPFFVKAPHQPFQIRSCMSREISTMLKFPPAIIEAILSALDIARVLPDDEMIRKGVPYLQNLIRDKLFDDKVKITKNLEKAWVNYWQDYFIK